MRSLGRAPCRALRELRRGHAELLAEVFYKASSKVCREVDIEINETLKVDFVLTPLIKSSP